MPVVALVGELLPATEKRYALPAVRPLRVARYDGTPVEVWPALRVATLVESPCFTEVETTTLPVAASIALRTQKVTPPVGAVLPGPYVPAPVESRLPVKGSQVALLMLGQVRATEVPAVPFAVV